MHQRYLVAFILLFTLRTALAATDAELAQCIADLAEARAALANNPHLADIAKQIENRTQEIQRVQEERESAVTRDTEIQERTPNFRGSGPDHFIRAFAEDWRPAPRASQKRDDSWTQATFRALANAIPKYKGPQHNRTQLPLSQEFKTELRTLMQEVMPDDNVYQPIFWPERVDKRVFDRVVPLAP